MSLVRLLNCLSPVNPEVRLMTEYDTNAGFLLKLAGGIGACVSAAIYFNTDDVKTVIMSGVIGAGLYIAGAVKDYLSLRRADQIQAMLEQHDKDLKDVSPFEYGHKHDKDATTL